MALDDVSSISYEDGIEYLERRARGGYGHPQIDLIFEAFREGPPDQIRILGHLYDLHREDADGR